MSYPERPLGEVLTLDCDTASVQINGHYSIAGVYSFGRGLFERQVIRGSGTQYKVLHRLHASTVVLSKLKAFEGAIAVVPDDFEGKYLSPEFPTFSIDETKSDPRYIHHLCSWPGLWSRLAEKSTGIGSRRERVSPQKLIETSIPLPDLIEQRRVGARLDLAMAKAGRIDSLGQSAALLRAGLIEALFHKFSMGPRRCMGDLADLERIPVDLLEDQEYIAIGIRSFGRGIFHRPAVRPVGLSKLKYFKIFPGRLIVSNIMAWEGAIALSTTEDESCIGSHRFLSYAPRQDISASYLNYFFQTREGKLSIAGASTGTVKRNQTLSIQDFESVMVPIPAANEQRRVVRMLDTAFLQIGSMAQQQQKELAAMRLALLNSAFTGRL